MIIFSVAELEQSMVVLLLFLFGLTTKALSLSACPNCGGLQVPYPLSTNDDCGNHNYRVYCNNGSLEFMSAKGIYYNILRIDPTAYKLVISPPIIMENTCYSSDVEEGGLLLDENLPFNVSTHNTVILLNCTENILRSPMDCSSISICRQFEEGVSGCMGTLCCHYLKDSAMASHRIRVGLFADGGCTAYTCLVDFKSGDPLSSWNYGIELQWLPPN